MARETDELGYRTLFDSVGVGVFHSTPEGRLIRANPKFASMLGFDSPAAMLSAVADIRTQVYVDPAAREAVIAKLTAEGRAEGGIIQLRRRDGTTIWGSVSSVVVAGPSGMGQTFLGTVIDVTDLVAARETLRLTEESYRSIVENAAEGIYQSSPDGRQLRANVALARLNGYETEAEMLAAVRDIASECYVDPQRRKDFMRLLAAHGRVQNFESEIYRHRTRERIWVSENARAVRDGEGRIVYYEGTVRDITSRKQTEARLREALALAERANRTKSEFLAAMSHELRTPLNAIIGFSEIITKEVFGPIGSARYRDYLGDILGSARHLARLIEDLLDLSRLDAGQMALDDGEVDLRAVIDDTVRMLELRARREKVALAVEIGPALPRLRGDRGRLQQVLINLIANAVKFTPTNGRVTVRAALAASGDMSVRIADTGIGIPPPLRAQVFEPFFQVAGGEQAEGVGLGLSIVRRLVELHGGTVAILDEPPPGTVFEVLLPRARVLSAPSPAPGVDPQRRLPL